MKSAQKIVRKQLFAGQMASLVGLFTVFILGIALVVRSSFTEVDGKLVSNTPIPYPTATSSVFPVVVEIDNFDSVITDRLCCNRISRWVVKIVRSEREIHSDTKFVFAVLPDRSKLELKKGDRIKMSCWGGFRFDHELNCEIEYELVGE